MTKHRMHMRRSGFGHSPFPSFEFVSDVEFRISDLPRHSNFGFASMNAIAYAHYRLRGGMRNILTTGGGYAALVLACIALSTAAVAPADRANTRMASSWADVHSSAGHCDLRILHRLLAVRLTTTT